MKPTYAFWYERTLDKVYFAAWPWTITNGARSWTQETLGM